MRMESERNNKGKRGQKKRGGDNGTKLMNEGDAATVRVTSWRTLSRLGSAQLNSRRPNVALERLNMAGIQFLSLIQSNCSCKLYFSEVSG